MATTSMSLPKFCTAERITFLPIRPNPFIPTLIAMSRSCKERRGKHGKGKSTLFYPFPARAFIPAEPLPDMKTMPRLLLAALLLLLAPAAHGWAQLGHRLIGELADRKSTRLNSSH